MLRRFLSLVMVVGLLALVLLVAGALPVLAASASQAPSSAAIAVALVAAWGILAPVTVYKFLPLKGDSMKAVTFLATLVIAALALLFSGEVHPDLASTGGILAFTFAAYGEQQFVWTLLKDQSNPKLAGLVTEPTAPAP